MTGGSGVALDKLGFHPLVLKFSEVNEGLSPLAKFPISKLANGSEMHGFEILQGPLGEPREGVNGSLQNLFEKWNPKLSSRLPPYYVKYI
eukprot:1352446-Amorphochlora_amoeboformis.AAC.1